MDEDDLNIKADWDAFDRLPPKTKWFMVHVHACDPVTMVLELYELALQHGMSPEKADQYVVDSLKLTLENMGVKKDFRPVEKIGSVYARPPTYPRRQRSTLEHDGWEIG